MTRMFRIVPIAFLFLIATSSVDRLEAQILLPEIAPTTITDYVAALSDYADAEPLADLDVTESETPSATENQPLPFFASTMAADLVPPFLTLPELKRTASTSSSELSFEENTPVTDKEETIDQCCVELANMIAGNLDSDISLDAKKQMVETALKMVSRNIALKAEAKITMLKAEHALEMARMRSQMGQMRSMGSVAHQINAIAGPLSQMLQRNYQQSLAANQSSERLSQTLAQIGYQRIENDAAAANQSRERIRLTRPSSMENERRLEALSEQIAYLQGQLNSFERSATADRVKPAAYNEALRPLRQPLAPLPRGYGQQGSYR